MAPFQRTPPREEDVKVIERAKARGGASHKEAPDATAPEPLGVVMRE